VWDQVKGLAAKAVIAAEPRLGTCTRAAVSHRNSCFEVRVAGCDECEAGVGEDTAGAFSSLSLRDPQQQQHVAVWDGRAARRQPAHLAAGVQHHAIADC